MEKASVFRWLDDRHPVRFSGDSLLLLLFVKQPLQAPPLARQPDAFAGVDFNVMRTLYGWTQPGPTGGISPGNRGRRRGTLNDESAIQGRRALMFNLALGQHFCWLFSCADQRVQLRVNGQKKNISYACSWLLLVS
jgi:hypothetical protein